jgi:hypothetical protein
MAFVKRITLAVMFLAVVAPIALAGPNAGGVLAVHATTLEYTVDTPTYVGLSGVACGQDQPEQPSVNQCPPYDPVDGALPCNPLAANPTLGIPPAGKSYVWYVMAAFARDSCPRLAGVAFRFTYDPTKVVVVASGTDPGNFAQMVNSDIDDAAFPASGSGVGVGFSAGTRTSWLQEVYWFAGYAYDGAVDATWTLKIKDANDKFFVDDSSPKIKDPIFGFGKLGLGGAAGENPTPALPTEETSWGRIKADYERK